MTPIPEFTNLEDFGHLALKEATGVKTAYLQPALKCLAISAQFLKRRDFVRSAFYATSCGMYTMLAVSSLFIPPDVKLLNKAQKFAQG